MNRTRSHPAPGDRRERGVVIVIMSIVLLALLVIAAIVVDLGNARQQQRQAVAAADAGALAGAQALPASTQVPSACPDANCAAAYYTFASASIKIANVAAMAASRTTCTLETVANGETCWQYASGRATVDVKSPYVLAATPDNTLVHVRICWDSPTAFAGVIGTKTIRVCGSATARNSGVGQGSASGSDPVADCSGEDNFADVNDNPTIYVFNPGDYPTEGSWLNLSKGTATPKHDEILAVVFSGLDADLNLNSISFTAPTAVSGPSGQSVSLPRVIPGDTKGPESSAAHGIGYTVQTLDSSGRLQPYTTGGTFRVVISYQLPADAQLKVSGASFVYSATLHAADKDQSPGPDCGNASWVLTHDGKNLPSSTPACGESSFLANGVFPSTGQAKPGDSVGAYYSDESPIQSHDVTDSFWNSQSGNYGIDFKLSGGAFTDASGKGFQIPPNNGTNGGYTLGAFPPGVPATDKYSTMIKWVLPPANDARWTNGIKYTVTLLAYDTDNNKAGNDCGLGTWSFVLTGATGSGKIRLIQ